jgi:hypothetical protein
MQLLLVDRDDLKMEAIIWIETVKAIRRMNQIQL